MTKEAVMTKGTSNNDVFNSDIEDVDNKSRNKTHGVSHQIGKNKLHSVNCSEQKDVVYGRYKINLRNQLPDFSTSLVRAYEVTDIKLNDNSKYYAVVLDKRYPSRLKLINSLLDEKVDNFTNIVAAQIIPLSTGEGRSFAAIIEKPQGMKLSEFLTINGPVNEDALIAKIIKPIFNVISFFETKKITHGRININNVYIDNTGKITLGECFSEVCGFSQPIIYEDVSRASVESIAKGVGHEGDVDFHALAVLAVICLRGKDIYENIPDKTILNLKYAKNTYRMITDGMEVSPYMSDFLRGAINENIRSTWDHERMVEWVGGRRYNLLPPTENLDAGRPILFNGKKFQSKKYLAYAMFLEWEEAKQFVKDNTLIRWVERSIQDTKLAEKMELLTKRSGGGEPGSSFDRDDELVAQYIMLLDPKGPMRIKGVSMNIDGIGPLLADGFANSNNEYIEVVRNIIKYSMVSYKEFESEGQGEMSSEKDSAFMLQKCSELYRKKYIGFGIERSLYELNPTLPCQSPIIKDYNSCVIPDLLLSLEKANNLKSDNFDIHLTSFLSARLELPVKLRIKSLTKFQDYAVHPPIQNLALLSVAQQTSQERTLPNLSKNVIATLDEVVETFHSRFVREDIRNDIKKNVGTGDLTKILEVISNTNYLVRDRLGFRRAVIAYRNNSVQIMKLNNKKAVSNMGYTYGLQLSVILTFIVASLVVIILIVKTF